MIAILLDSITDNFIVCIFRLNFSKKSRTGPKFKIGRVTPTQHFFWGVGLILAWGRAEWGAGLTREALTYFHLHGLLEAVHALRQLAQHGAQEADLLVLLVDRHLQLPDLVVRRPEELLDAVVSALPLAEVCLHLNNDTKTNFDVITDKFRNVFKLMDKSCANTCTLYIATSDFIHLLRQMPFLRLEFTYISCC